MYLKRIELRMVLDKAVPYGPIPVGVPRGVQIKNSWDVFMSFGFLSERVQEEVYALYLDGRNRILGFYMVSRGGVDRSHCIPADVIRPALLTGSCSVILVHNHPSGDPEPSSKDLEITKRVKEACDVMEVKFLDHVIIGSEGFYSLADNGKL